MKTYEKYFIERLMILLLIGFLAVNCQNNHQKSNAEITKTVKSQTAMTQIIPKGTAINILVDKSDYRLYVYAADTIIKTYPIVLGGNPVDDKLQQGDQCTPEGSFKMRSKYPHKNWSKFIWINYPTSDSWHKHKQAKASGEILGNAKIGGEIGIHGVPKGTDSMINRGINWTLGCISMTNTDINELYPFVNDKTMIRIQK